VQKIINIISKLNKKKIKKNKDFFDYLLNPFIIVINLVSFVYLINQLDLNLFSNVQVFMAGIILILFFILPILRRILFKKPLKTHIMLYSSFMIYACLVKNPIILLIMIVPIIGKESSLYLKLKDLFKGNIYLLYLKDFLDKEIKYEN